MIERVRIIQTDRPRPMYHRFDHVEDITTGPDYSTPDYVDVMACGAKVRLRYSYFTAMLRREHAIAFARPCGKCFPETR